MKVLLLGTGSRDGWPQPFCRCASCADAVAGGRPRARTSVLVDERLLLDGGTDAALAAARAGTGLTEVTHLLLTGVPGADPAALVRARTTAAVVRPLTVAGPASALRALQHTAGDAGTVQWHPLAPGDELRAGAHGVRVLGGAPAAGSHDPHLLYQITGTDGARMLYAPAPGPISTDDLEPLRDAACGLVLLDETHGEADPEHDRPGSGRGHLDLAAFGVMLGRLRDMGAVAGDGDVVAVHLSHANPAGGRLQQLLYRWGARVVDDLTELVVRPRPQPGTASPSPLADRSPSPLVVPLPLRTLVLGGARSGKSAVAEHLLGHRGDVTYVATGPGASGGDPEWAARVAAHRARRPERWRTEESVDLAEVLARAPGPVLVDGLGQWLTAMMDRHRAWESEAAAPGSAPGWGAAVSGEMDALLAAWRAARWPVVAVSDEVGWGVVPATWAGRAFRDTLGRLNQRLAGQSEQVLLVVAGQVLDLSAREPG